LNAAMRATPEGPMSRIQAAVGRKGMNLPQDVLVVARLVNKNLGQLIPYRELPEVAIPMENLISMVEEFQRRVLKMPKPDGRVEPGGKTLAKLLELAGEHDRPAHVQAFIDMALPAAMTVKAKYRIPPSALIAQAALESGWGTKVKGNAYFGIKGSSGTEGGTTFTTREVIDGKDITINDTFRAYGSFGEAAEGYGKFLSTSPNFAAAMQQTGDSVKFVQAVAKGGYATDPNYASTLQSIIKSFSLQDYDK
jgi:flagellar protein FlgJ